ncbi:MAG TPA: molecular chaperone TorD family protein [Acidimicrobiales bacterium]|nr:molecular chaperone TorD family protein [Acidimicrobiales bacterium]
MTTETTVVNSAGEHRKTAARTATAEATTGAGEPVAGTIIAALDLLSHFWSRPVGDEVDEWRQARDFEVEAHRRLSSDVGREPVWLPADLEESLGLLDEYERLFVGPGQVPCPPYESFWREDVPVDIRRTLMGPCTAELRRLYNQLGLEMSSYGGELPDHIAVECEALAYALSLEDAEQIACELFAHFGHWLPRFCRAVAKEAEHPFYRDLAPMTLDWLVAVRSYFAADAM